MKKISIYVFLNIAITAFLDHRDLWQHNPVIREEAAKV